MKKYSIILLYRIIFLIVSILGLTWFTIQMKMWYFGIISGTIIVGIQTYGLYHYTLNTNRKLIRFFESIQYSDFTLKFRSDNHMGESFQDLNRQLNDVLEAFRQARAEREASLHYINTIVQHVNVGLISFSASGNIELINSAAFRILGVYRLRNISELNKTHPNLAEILNNLTAGGKSLYRASEENQISINSTTVSLRGRIVKLVTFQNIQSELQEKELEAWQNLTKILRHEIMNSITPIVSLIDTMKDIIEMDLSGNETNKEAIYDLREALQTIESRGRGIMSFVNAYREFTSIPTPKFGEIEIKTLISDIVSLIQPQLKQNQITLKLEIDEQLLILADVQQIEMVLINILRNATEALEKTEKPEIIIKAYTLDNQNIIQITDNGTGIEQEALEKIFIPFYTTKKTGSGIGLSLSRQIMQMNKGNLKVVSELGESTTFLMNFPQL